MELNYQKKLSNWNITDLTDPALDGQFVSKARTFEAALKKNTLSPEEIEATDNELCELFDDLHEFEEVDDSTVTQLKTQNLILAVKEQVNASSDLKELTDMANKYSDYPEILGFIDSRAAIVTVEIEKQNQEAAEAARLESEAKEKAEAEKGKTENSLQAKLLSKTTWKYSELEVLGIQPTDKDMIVDGVYLEQQYMFTIYKVKGLVKNS
jgi:hypothetical protein